MVRAILLVFVWVQIALCATTFAADETGFLEVVEVVAYHDDPVYEYVQHWAETLLRAFEHEKMAAMYNKDKDGKEIAKAKIEGMKNFVNELRIKVKRGMTEIRGWDGVKEEPIVIQCRSDKTRSVAKRYRPGDFINFTANSSFKTVAMRTVNHIDWRRGKKNGVMTNIPKVRDKLEWHWSIGGWNDEYVIESLLAIADKSKNYVYGNSRFSKPQAKLTPIVLEAVALSKSKHALYGWKCAPPHYVYPWTIKQDLKSTVTASLNKCVFDGRTTHCVVLDGDIDNVYSLVVQVYGFREDEGKGKRLSPRKGFAIGGATGGIFGSTLGKHVKKVAEFPVNGKVYVRYEVEIIEILVYEH